MRKADVLEHQQPRLRRGGGLREHCGKLEGELADLKVRKLEPLEQITIRHQQLVRGFQQHPWSPHEALGGLLPRDSKLLEKAQPRLQNALGDGRVAHVKLVHRVGLIRRRRRRRRRRSRDFSFDSLREQGDLCPFEFGPTLMFLLENVVRHDKPRPGCLDPLQETVGRSVLLKDFKSRYHFAIQTHGEDHWVPGKIQGRIAVRQANTL
mmetsp:Transcript_101865/g.286186  ORF Transcript_101865/g.286186 Transcript_101865/m.286186 type:complete len:208 (+) Transcript_101865:301-924(+)